MTGRSKGIDDSVDLFREGACYFLLGYYDEDFNLPSVETFIYLGKNLLGEDATNERWYFQQAESFVRNGRVLPSPNRNNEDILSTSLEHLKDFLNSAQLGSLLSEMGKIGE